MSGEAGESGESANENAMKHVIGIIPARFGSSRMPGKPLVKVRGISLIERVYQRAKRAASLDEVYVATDDIRIANHVEKFGGKAMMTRIDHRSGTFRCAEVAEAHPARFVVNIQGDEPLVSPAEIDRLARFISSGNRQIATLVKRLDNAADLQDPGEAKVILDHQRRAVYFSRSPIPFVRDHPKEIWHEKATFFKHIGMYAYSAEALRKIAGLPVSALEEAESLEQLSWIYHGIPIDTLETDIETIDIDTPEDLHVLERILGLSEEG